MTENRIKVSLGNGRYEYIDVNELYNDSDSGDESFSDDDYVPPAIPLAECPLTENASDTTAEPLHENVPVIVSDPDEELNNLLQEFNETCHELNAALKVEHVPEVPPKRSRRMRQKSPSPEPGNLHILMTNNFVILPINLESIFFYTYVGPSKSIPPEDLRSERKRRMAKSAKSAGVEKKKMSKLQFPICITYHI